MKPANVNQSSQAEPAKTIDTLKLCPQSKTTGSADSADSTSAPGTIPASDSNDILAIIKRDRAESLKRKQRTDSFLHRLNDAQLTKVLQWLDEEEDIGIVYHNITAPAPEGLGLEVGLSTIRRLRAHVTATHANHRATEILDTILDMESTDGLSPAAQSERIQSAINHLLHQKAFELARTEPGAPELRELLDTIEKLAALDLKRQKIALDREKMLRHDKRSSNPPPPRSHKVELKILPSTSRHRASQRAVSAKRREARQPVQIIAPLPDVIA